METWHNATSRFILGQEEFAQSTARSGAKHTKIISNLHQTAGDRVEGSTRLNQSIIACQSLELVGRSHKRQA